MAAERVVSKNLFNFRPAGKIDDDILEMEKAMMDVATMNEMKEKLKNMKDEEFGEFIQTLMDQQFAVLGDNPTVQEVHAHDIECVKK